MAITQKTVTPRLSLAWIKITGEGEENMSGKLQYLASGIMDPKNNEADAAYIASIDAFWEENRPAEKRKAKSKGYYLNDPLLDKDGNKQYDDDDKLIKDPDGKVLVTFKTGTTFPDGKGKVVKIYNSKNKIVSLGDVSIGNGSEGHISGAMGIYINKVKNKIQDAGVTLYLDAIQLKKFIAYTGADAGFAADDEEEGGFTGVDEDAGFEGEEANTETKPRL